MFGLIFGVVWAAAVAAVVFVAIDTNAIQYGLLVASSSFLAAAAYLWLVVFIRARNRGPLLQRAHLGRRSAGARRA